MQPSLKVAAPADVFRGFFERVQHANARLLMLDYDGTLAPFRADRGRAIPYPGISDLISRIMQSYTRVVLISGRAASELLLLCGVYPHPEIWGSHGSERIYPDGSYHIEQLTAAHRAGLELADFSLRAAGLAAYIETKPAALAIHWRGLSVEDRAEVENKTRAIYADEIKDHGLQLLPFDGGLEIRSHAKTKGDAVRTVLRECGQGVAAAYLGDDQTDEDAFRAIKRHGLAVLVRGEPRPTDADAWLRPPDELRQFFENWLVACGAEP